MPTPLEPMRNTPPSKFPVTSPIPAPRPERIVHQGTRVRLEPLDPARHGDDLHRLGHDSDAALASWTYLPYGPFASKEEHLAWLTAQAASNDPLFFTIVDQTTNEAVGIATLMTIEPAAGSIEIGHLWFSPKLQQTPAATEALYLLLHHALVDLQYRRMEWKCDAMNAPSRRAAMRLGYQPEGLFYQHRVVKGQNRDTAWYSILDAEWPRLEHAFQAWLAPENFDENGAQRRRLSELTQPPAE